MSIRLADGPSQCSACFQQRTEDRHIDFDAAWDGPVFDVNPDSGFPRSQIDDLILCEPCIRRAAELLSIKPQVMADLEREVERLKLEAAERHQYLEGLEDLIPRRPGRPKKMTQTLQEA